MPHRVDQVHNIMILLSRPFAFLNLNYTVFTRTEYAPMTSHTDLIVKALTAPVLVGSASLIGRRWSPAVSGWLLSLPMISGPVLAFLTVERGRAFTANAAFGGMLGLLSFALFYLIYSHACSRLGWFGSSTCLGWILPAGIVVPWYLCVGNHSVFVCSHFTACRSDNASTRPTATNGSTRS
jgi:hypothetical protein